MRTGTTTRIEIGCVAGPDGRTRVVGLSASGLLRARVLPADQDGVARVALVQTAASLLSGDRVAIAVDAGAGCRLEVVEVAGMIAHDVRGGDGAALDVAVVLAEGAQVAWLGQPLTLCAGCDLQRTTRASLADGAALLWRDTLVLGRVGETAGRLESSTDIQHNDAELHVEQLDTGDLALLSSCVVAGAGVRALDTLALYGRRAEGDQALQLAGEGTLIALPAASLTSTAARLDPLARRWRQTLFPTLATRFREDAHDDVRLAV